MSMNHRHLWIRYSATQIACRLALAGLLIAVGGSIAVGQKPDSIANPNLQPPAGAPLPVKPGKAVAKPATPEQLAKWAKDLDSDEFLVREDATQQLVRAGLPAVEVCQKVLKQPTPESGSRALHVLHQLALSNDIDVLDAARVTLEEMTRSKSSPLRFRAEEVLAQLNTQRQAITLGELEGLGARIRRTQYVNGFALDEVVQSLEIGHDWRGTDDDLRRLKWLSDVRQIALVGDRATDAVLKNIPAMKGLRSVQAYRANITDEGVKSLAACPQLEDVGLYYIPVSNESLNVLKNVRTLTSVRVYGTRATPEVAAELQAGMGAGKVDFRHGAFLGVGCITVDTNCAISRVNKDSPADRAGILQEDIVLSFNNEAVPDFETLTTIISKLKAGDMAELQIQRVALDNNSQPVPRKVTIKVPLGEWPVEQFIFGANRE
jgi:hypothetical protein